MTNSTTRKTVPNLPEMGSLITFFHQATADDLNHAVEYLNREIEDSMGGASDVVETLMGLVERKQEELASAY